MRHFTEIGLRPDNIESVISCAKKLGYTTIGLEKKNARAKSTNIDVASRLDLDPRNSNELLQKLRKNRWNTEVIIVNCKTKKVARQAGKDRRVDLITYPTLDRWKDNHLDRQQARLMRDSGTGYLIDVSQLISTEPLLLRKRIEYIKRNKDNAIKQGVPVVASSFATNVWNLRDPYGLAALLSLIDIDKEHAIDMVSTNPYHIVEENRVKLKDSYIVQGVWVIEDK